MYAALTLGFSIGGSTVAAIIGYGLFAWCSEKGKRLLKTTSTKTIASGINTAGTGVVFTLPALFMLDAKMRSETGIGLLEGGGQLDTAANRYYTRWNRWFYSGCGVDHTSSKANDCLGSSSIPIGSGCC